MPGAADLGGAADVADTADLGGRPLFFLIPSEIFKVFEARVTSRSGFVIDVTGIGMSQLVAWFDIRRELLRAGTRGAKSDLAGGGAMSLDLGLRPRRVGLERLN